MKTKLFLKYLALLSAVTLAPLSFLGYRLTSIGQTSVKTALMELQLAKADAAAAGFDNYSANISEKTGLLRKKLGVNNWQGKLQLFNSFLEMNPEITAVSVVSASGQEIVKALPAGETSGNKELLSYSGSKDFDRAKAERRSPGLYLSAASENLVCYLPFGDKFFLRTEAALDKPLAALELGKAGHGGNLVLADSEGQPLIPPGLREGPQRVFLSEVRGWTVFDAAVRNHRGSGAMEFNDSGRAMLGAYAPFRNAEGAVIIVKPLETAYHYVFFIKKQAGYTVFAVMLLVFMALVLVSWRLAGRLSGEEQRPGGNFVKRAWDSLKRPFREGSDFPWGKSALVLFPGSLLSLWCSGFVKFPGGAGACGFLGATAFSLFLVCLPAWADQAVGRRNLRRTVAMPLHITLKILTGTAVLVLMGLLALISSLLCGVSF